VRTVFIARAQGTPRAEEDFADAQTVSLAEVPASLAFDHVKILADFLAFRRSRGT
jgi:hypothetical protein